VDVAALIEVARRAGDVLAGPMPGKLHRLLELQPHSTTGSGRA
jgi:hypothetical protein